MLAEDIKIASLIHPYFLANSNLWHKYRLTYQGGENFIRTYLQKFSKREDEKDFFFTESNKLFSFIC